MSPAEILFQEIVAQHPAAITGKLFGAHCIKTLNGKSVAIFWKDHLLVKLSATDQQKALKWEGVVPASHLYAPERSLKGWLSIPFGHSEKWPEFVQQAIEFGKTFT